MTLTNKASLRRQPSLAVSVLNSLGEGVSANADDSPENGPSWDQALVNMGIAHSVVAAAPAATSKPPKTPTRSRFRSRFFFRLDSEIVDQQKAAVAPPKIDYADAAVTNHAKRWRKILPRELSTNIDLVREFFVNELSPLTLAISTGSDQAREVLKVLTGSEVDPEAFYRFEQMAHQAVLIRLSIFLEQYLGLPKGTSAELLPGRPNRQPSATPAVPLPSDDSGSSSRKDLRSLNRKLQRLLDQQQSGDTRGITPTEG